MQLILNKIMEERSQIKRKTCSPKIISSISLEYLQSTSSPYLNKQSKLAYKSFGEALKIRKKSKNQTQQPKSITDLSISFLPNCPLPKIEEKGNIKSKPMYFKDKLRRQLQKAESKSISNEQYYNLYNDLFEELAEFLAPFTDILRQLKDGIIFYNKPEGYKNCEDRKTELEVIKLEKSVENLNRDKEILVKKLNKLLDELDKYKKENYELVKRITPQMDKFLDYDRVIENLLRQSNTIQNQNIKIKELTQGNTKLSKVIEKLRNSNINIDTLFEQVNKEVIPDCLMTVK